ncbi:MAG: aminopeptidase P family protein [Bacillota bacterium]|nr:aminopeptidase P family protein [Bacillota bacterium]
MKQHLERLIKAFPKNLDAILLTSPVNRLYVSGFDASDDMILVTPESSYFLADGRYIEEVRNKVPFMTSILATDFYDTLRELISKHNIKTLGFEDMEITVFRYNRLKNELNVELNPIGSLMFELRKRKTPDEVSKMTWAQAIADRAFSYILNIIKPGMTEREVMLTLREYYVRQGSEGDSFEPIVVSGKNSSLPHGLPSDKVIERGDFITMDFGCVVQHYRSDMTRTIAVGYATDEMRKVYDIVLEAQKAALSGIHSGMTGAECDKIARDIIDNAGYKDCFGHGLGHSVGLEIHEPPRFSPRSTDIIEAGTVMTVEPGVYFEGAFGVRIEDMVLMTQNGCENFTKSKKELIIL